jgi:hypothetical protein
MQIVVELNGITAAEKGVQIEDILKDLEAEISGFVRHVGAENFEQSKKPAPQGAQGEFELLQFVIEIAKEPTAIKAAISALVYAVNEIISAKGKSSEDDLAAKKVSKLKILGKEIALPASIAVIKQFIEDITNDD